MSKAFLVTFAVAAMVIGGLIWYGFADTKGNHLAPTGAIGKIRAAKADDDITYVVIDFHAKNDSDVDMIVRSIEVSIDTADGKSINGSAVAKADVDSAFKSFPLLGEQYNPVLRERDKIPAHQEIDRMVGIRFDAPYDTVAGRKALHLKLTDITGVELEMTK